MVVFTCNHCGDSLQKPKVAKHYQFQCRSRQLGISLTCVDCFKDFLGDQYEVHTKCITEAERYGGRDFKAKTSMNKGERKQQEWINIVKNVLESNTNLSHDERQMLNLFSRYENIPRKKAKFLNFVKNVVGFRANMNVVESCWAKMEAAFKETTEAKANDLPKKQIPNGKSEETEQTSPEETEAPVLENENNENISRENCNSADTLSKDPKKKEKKSKKRSLAEDSGKTAKVDDEPAPKQQKTKSDVDVDVAVDDNVSDKFNWKATILETLGSKEEISLKKLRKKVLAKYLSHVGESVTSEKAASRFDKKLNKIPTLTLDNDKVRRAQC